MDKPDPYAFWFNRDQIKASHSQATTPAAVHADAPRPHKPTPYKLFPSRFFNFYFYFLIE
jgi:hypothetical protein